MSSSIGPEIEGLTFVESLGSGGYSDVYLYERLRPRMRVAVKVLTGERLSPIEMAQFAAEAETMAELADHPYIVQVFTTGVTTGGRPYLVMKYYPPPNLGRRAASERFSIADVLRTGIKIGSAVETAHRAGILHRDIKPANILVSQYGEPGLTDFGIAGRTADVDDDEDLGVSIPWSAPEVLSGSSNGTARSDVYSLGATVWHLLAGRSPFEIVGGDNSSRAIMARVLRSAPPATGRADAPTSLDRLLQQAMAKEPHHRPKSALEFTRGLQAVEQELRFARTDIVVGADGTAPPVAQHGATPDSTRIRASRPQPVDPSELARVWAPRNGPDTVARWGPPTSPPHADAPAANAPTPPAVVLPVAVPPPATPPDATARRAAKAASAPPRTPGSPAKNSDPATIRRGTRPEPAKQPGEKGDISGPVEPPIRGWKLKASHVAVGTALLALAGILITVLALSSGSGNSRANSAPPTNKATDQGGFSSSPAVAAPTVHANVDRTRTWLTFTWSPQPAGATSHGYVYWFASDPSRTTRTTQTRLRIRATSNPSSVCIVVAALTAGGQRIPAEQVCG